MSFYIQFNLKLYVCCSLFCLGIFYNQTTPYLEPCFVFLILSVPDDGYFRNASCALILISTFLFDKIEIDNSSCPAFYCDQVEMENSSWSAFDFDQVEMDNSSWPAFDFDQVEMDNSSWPAFDFDQVEMDNISGHAFCFAHT